MQKEAKLYMLMMTFLSFALTLSNVFISIFIWNINNSFTLLALNSLAYSIAVLVSFPISAWYGRKRSPMASSRLGIVLLIIAYGYLLYLREHAVHHVIELGIMIGLGTAFFVIGQHMQTLDSTDDRNRDRFLYLTGFLTNGVGMLAPILSGFIIHHSHGTKGYYIVFTISLAAFVVTAIVSMFIRGKKLPDRSYFVEVWNHPTREWRGMYWISIGTSIVEGTYSSFLVTIMTFTVLGNALSLGGYNTCAAFIGLLASIVLAKLSRPSRRKAIYAIGSVLVAFASILLSMFPTFWALVIYGIVAIVGMNLIATTLDSWAYASIEMDSKFEERRLDYIVIREIPIGIGRMLGIGIFFLLQCYFTTKQILPISFAIFGSIFLFLTPGLYKIWKHEV